MKKLLTVLLTLLLVFSLPVFAMAEEVTTSAETLVEEATTVETVEEQTEIYEEEDAKTSFGFYPGTLLDTLPIMGMGMLGIFLVTCVIILAVLILSKVGGKKDEE